MSDPTKVTVDDVATFVADIASGAYNEDGVDVTLIRWFLRLTPAERLDSSSSAAQQLEEMRTFAASHA